MDLMSLLIRIGADTAEAEKGINSVQNGMDETAKKSTSFGTKFGNAFKTAGKIVAGTTAAVVACGAAVFKLASNAASTTDHIDKMSQKLGISREAYQELDFVMSQSGTSIDSMQMGMKTLRSQMDKVNSGNKDATKTFKRLGIQVKNTDGTFRRQEDVFFDAVTALQGVTDETEKAQLATELFGRSGTELLPLLNGEVGSMEELREEAHRLGIVLDDDAIDAGVHLTDTIDKVKRSFDAIITKIGVEVMPMVQSALDWVLDNMPAIQDVVGGVVGFIANVVGKVVKFFIDTVIPFIKNFIDNNIKPNIKWFEDAFSSLGLFIENLIDGNVFGAVEWLKTFIYDAIAGILNVLGVSEEDTRAIMKRVHEVLDWLGKGFMAVYEFITKKFAPWIAKAWTETIGPAIRGTIRTIVKFWNEKLKPALEAIWSYITETLAPAIYTAWVETIQPAVETAINAIAGFWNDTLKPAFKAIYDYIVNDLIPAFNDMGEDFNEVKDNYLVPIANYIIGEFKDAWSDIKTYWNKFIVPIISKLSDLFSAWWENILKPFAEFIAGAFSEVWDNLRTFWEETLMPKLEALSQAFNNFKNRVLVPIKTFLQTVFIAGWKKISEFFGGDMTNSTQSLGDTFKDLWNNYLKPIYNWIKNSFIKSLEIIESTLAGLIDFLTNVFNGDWQGAWNTIVDTFNSVFGSIVDTVKDPINAVIDAINWMIDGIESAVNWVIDSINKKLTLHWDLKNPFTNGSLFKIDWSPDLKRVSWGHIDKIMATGGFLDEGQNAIVGERRPERLSIINGHAFVQPIGGVNPGDRFGNGSTYNNTVNIYQQPGETSEELAERVERVFVRWQKQEDAVWA